MKIDAEKLMALVDSLEDSATDDIYWDAEYYGEPETAESIKQRCSDMQEAAAILRQLAEGPFNGAFLMQDCQEEDIIKLMPEACPECGEKEIEIDGNQALIADAAIGRFVDGGKFLVFEIKDHDPLYFIAYGWQCSSCGHEVTFERVMRVAYV